MTNDEFKRAITEVINHVNDTIILKRIYIFITSIIG